VLVYTDINLLHSWCCIRRRRPLLYG